MAAAKQLVVDTRSVRRQRGRGGQGREGEHALNPPPSPAPAPHHPLLHIISCLLSASCKVWLPLSQGLMMQPLTHRDSQAGREGRKERGDREEKREQTPSALWVSLHSRGSSESRGLLS